MAFYDTMIVVAGTVLRGLYRVELRGKENIPPDTEDNQTPAYLLCANHMGLLDPFVIGSAIRVKIYWMAKESLFRVPIVKQIITAFGAYPVSRGTGDVGAIKKSVELLKNHKSVGIFPQGHRHPGEEPRNTEIRYGAGMMAYRAGCDMLPVCIETENRRMRPFKKTVIIVGKRIPFSELGLDGGSPDTYRAATERVFDAICTLSEDYGREKRQ